MNFKIRSVSNSTIISLYTAKATAATANQLKESVKSIIAKGCQNIIVDCRPLISMDPNFAGALIHTKLWMNGIGGELKVIRSKRSPAWNILNSFKFKRILSIFFDLEEALESNN